MFETTKRLGAVVLLVASSLLFVTGAAMAQGTTGAASTQGVDPALDIAELFVWITPEAINWSLGALLAAGGLVGALATTFSLIGGAIPGTVGTARIDKDAEQLERFSRRLEELVSDRQHPPQHAELLDKVASTVDTLRRYLSRERWRQFILASILYTVLGAAFASALAQDLLQAFVIGAGWTGLIGSFGLRTDYGERKDQKDVALNEVLTELRTELQTQLANLDAAPSEEETAKRQREVDRLERLLRRADLARTL